MKNHLYLPEKEIILKIQKVFDSSEKNQLAGPFLFSKRLFNLLF